MKKIIIIAITIMVAILPGCNKVIKEELPKNSVAYNEKGEIIAAPEKTENTGSEAVKNASTGAEIIYNVPATTDAAGLTKTVLTYYFNVDKVCAVKVENTYTTPELAENAAKDFATKPESCKEVTVSDCTIRFYSSQNGIDSMADMTKDSLKEVAETMGGTYKEF